MSKSFKINLNEFAKELIAMRQQKMGDTKETQANTKAIKENAEAVEKNTKTRKKNNQTVEESVTIKRKESQATSSSNKSNEQEEKTRIKLGKVTKTQLDNYKAISAHLKGDKAVTEYSVNAIKNITAVGKDIDSIKYKFESLTSKISDLKNTQLIAGSKSFVLKEEGAISQPEFEAYNKSAVALGKQSDALKDLYSRYKEVLNAKELDLNALKALDKEYDNQIKKTKELEDNFKLQEGAINRTVNSMEALGKRLKETEGIDITSFTKVISDKGGVKVLANDLGQILKITKEVTASGTKFSYSLENQFKGLSQSTEKTYQAVNRLNKGINNLRKTSETEKALGLKQQIDETYNSMKNLEKEIAVLSLSEKSNKKIINEKTKEYVNQKKVLETLSDEYKELNAQIRNQGGWMLNLKDSWTKAMRSFTTYMSVTTVFYQGIHALKDMVAQVKELDASLVELQKVTDLEGRSLEKFVDQAYEMGETVAKTGREMIEAATEFARSGYGEEQILQLGQIAAMYTNIADEEISTANAAEFIISQMKAFNIEASKSEHIIDAVNEVSNNFAVSSADIANNLGKASAVMANAGNTLEETIGLMTAGTEITRNASKVANGLKTITLRLQGMNDEGEKDLEVVSSMEKLYNKLGISAYDSSGGLKSSFDILKDLSEIYPKLTNAEKAYVTETIAGKYQAQNAAAILNNFQVAIDATATAMNSAGSATKENERVLDSIQGHIQKLNSQWEELSRNMIESNVIKMVVDFGTALLQAANSGVGQFIIKTALLLTGLKGLETAISMISTKFNAMKMAYMSNALAQTALTEKSREYIVNLLAEKGAINSHTGMLAANTREKILNALAGENLTKEQQIEIMKLIQLNAAQNKATVGVGKMTKAWKGFTAFLKSNAIGLIITAIAMAVNAFTSAVEKNREQLQAYEESIEELEGYSNNISKIQKQLENGNLTDKERASILEELNSLQDELNEKYKIGAKVIASQDNSGLKEQVDYLQNLIDLKEQEIALDILKDIDPNDASSYFSFTDALYETLTDFWGSLFHGQEKAATKYQEYSDKVTAAIINSNIKVKKAVKELEDAINDPNITPKKLEELRDNIYQVMKGEGYAIDSKEIFWVTEYTDKIYEEYNKALVDVFKKQKYDEVTKQFQSQLNRVISTAVENEIDSDTIRELLKGMDNGGKLIGWLLGIYNAAHVAGMSMEEFFNMWIKNVPELQSISDMTEMATTSLSSLSDQIKDIVDKYNLVKDALDEYNQTGEISYDTVAQIIEAGQDYIDALVDENGNIRDNTDAVKALADAKLNEMQTSEDNRYYNELLALAQKDESYWAQYAAGSVNQYNKSLGGTAPNAAKLRAEIEKNIASFDDLASAALESAYAAVESQHAQRNALIQAARVNYTKGTTTKTTPTSTGKAQWEKDLDSLNQKYKNSEITIEQYITKLEALRKKYKKNKDAVKELDEAIRQAKLDKLEDDYKRGLIGVEEYVKGLKELQSQYKKNTKTWNDYADKIKKGIQEILSLRKKDYESAKSAAEAILDEQIKAIEAQKDATEKYYDDLIAQKEKANDETEKEIQLAKLQEALYNAQTQRTKRVYVEGMGWQWVQDAAAIKEAQEALDEFNQEQELSELEAQKEEAVKNLQDQIDALEEYKKAWEDVTHEYEMEQNRLILIQTLGANAEADILNQRLEVLEDFRDKYIAVLKDIETVDNRTADDISTNGITLQSGGSFANGGVVDFTGFARVHGSANRPEVMLNNEQAARLYSMVSKPQTTPMKAYNNSTSSIVYNFDNLVLPNVNNAQQFITALKTQVNLNKNN